MIKSKQISEINDRIKQLEAVLDEVKSQRTQLGNLVYEKLDKILCEKFETNCCGVVRQLNIRSSYGLYGGWRNAIEAHTMRLLAFDAYGDEDAVLHLISGLTVKGVLEEKFYWMDEDEDINVLDDDLQTHMKNVIILQESGIDNFPDGVEGFEKHPFDPILGESCSLEEMKDGMIPIWYATQEFLDAIKEAEQTLVDTGEFEYV